MIEEQSNIHHARYKAMSIMKTFRAEKLAFQILKISPFLVFLGSVTSPEFLWVNDKVLEYLGWEFDEIVNINWLSLIHPDDRQKSLDAFLIFQKTGKIGFEGEQFTNRYRTKKGLYKEIIWNSVMESKEEMYMIFGNI